MRVHVRVLVIAATLAAGTVIHSQETSQAQPVTGTGAISGVVTDGVTGRPIAGAVIYVGMAGRAGGGNSRQLTDPKGRFVFTDLPAHDQYFLNASGFGYVNGGYGQTPLRPSQTRIRLAQGEWFKDAHIQLWPPAAVSGRVFDERGEPVVGVPVRVLAQILVGGRPQIAAGLSTITDDRGAYRIAGLRAGRYFVQVPSVQKLGSRGRRSDRGNRIRTQRAGVPARRHGHARRLPLRARRLRDASSAVSHPACLPDCVSPGGAHAG